MAVNGMRGSDTFSPAQRPGNFGGKINLVPNVSRVSREEAAAKVAASRPKSMKGQKGKMPRFKKFMKE